MSAPHPPEVIAAIADRLSRGDSRRDIAADLEVSRHSVDRVAAANGLKGQARRQPRQQQRSRIFLAADLEWMRWAACRKEGPDFGEQSVAEQKTICRDCTVQLECLEYILQGPIWSAERGGKGTVAAGLGPPELAKLKRKRSRLQVVS